MTGRRPAVSAATSRSCSGRRRREGGDRRPARRPPRGKSERISSPLAASAPISCSTSPMMHVSQASAFDLAERALGPLDILVNNAGVNMQGLATEQRIEEFDTVLDTNLRGPRSVAREAGTAHDRARRRRARQSLIGSIGTFRVLPGVTTYCMAKAAIGMMTQCLAHEWARYDITVNAICPGCCRGRSSTDTWFHSEKRAGANSPFSEAPSPDRERSRTECSCCSPLRASRAITGSLLNGGRLPPVAQKHPLGQTGIGTIGRIASWDRWQGVRIVEFAGIKPGPFAAMLLSDMGAEIIRIDRKRRRAPRQIRDHVSWSRGGAARPEKARRRSTARHSS